MNKKTYHTYSCAALEKNLEQCNINITTYEGIILKEQEQKVELLRLIAEAKERDALLGT